MNFNQFKAKYQKKPVEHYFSNVSSKNEVSIIVVTFQHANYIKQCLDSILSQKTNFSFEILIGEDGSNDGTREICIEYAKKHPKKIRLFLHNRENNIFIEGKATGRFNLIYSAFFSKGDFLSFCEGDDYWTDPLKLQKQVDYLKENENYSICFTHQLVVSNTGATINKNEYQKKDYSTSDIIQGFIPGTQTMLIRNFESLASFLTMHTKSPSGDRILAYFCSLFGDIYLLPEFTAAYRQSGKGVWTSISDEEQYFLSLKYYIKFHLSLGVPLNNEYIHKRINGAYFYWLKSNPRKLLEVRNKIKQLKIQYGIKSNFLTYILSKLK